MITDFVVYVQHVVQVHLMHLRLLASNVRSIESLLEAITRAPPARSRKISMPLVMPLSLVVTRTLHGKQDKVSTCIQERGCNGCKSLAPKIFASTVLSRCLCTAAHLGFARRHVQIRCCRNCHAHKAALVPRVPVASSAGELQAVGSPKTAGVL